MRRTIASSGASTSASSREYEKKSTGEEEGQEDEDADAAARRRRSAICKLGNAGRRDGRRDPGARPLLSLRRDGDHARPVEGVRLQDRGVPPRRRGVQDRRPAGRRTACAAPSGPTGGASRWRCSTACRRTSRSPICRANGCAIVHSDSDEGIQRLNQEAAKAMSRGTRVGPDIPPERAIRWLTANPGACARHRRSSPARSSPARWATS